MPLELDRTRIETALGTMTERLEGDWLLVGGALVALWLTPRRVTEDIDLVGLTGSPEERLRVMEIASEAGLPIEAVNSAADFFVRRIHGWRDEIEIFRKGPRARIYRPSPTLFLLLKVGRLSEQDLDDCLAMIRKAETENLHLELGRVLEAISALPESQDSALEARRLTLKLACTGSNH